MFGPQSGSEGIGGLKVVLCLPDRPVDPRRVAALRGFLEADLGLEVFEMSAGEHDAEMAYIQGLTHWMGEGRCARFTSRTPPSAPSPTGT